MINDGFLHQKVEEDRERVAGIEPASLAWKARGYSRRQCRSLNVSNSKPNMKLWFHSAPLWKIKNSSIEDKI